MKRKPQRQDLQRAIEAFCRQIGFTLDYSAPSHRRAVERTVDETHN